MKVETPFFQFYEFVLFLVVCYAYRLSCLYPILKLCKRVFSEDENTIKNDNSTKFAIVYKRVATVFLRC
jgi:hypothetical protein